MSRRLLSLGLALTGIVLVAFLAQSIIEGLLLRPLIHQWWQIRLYLRSTPQIYAWFLVVTGILLISLVSLLRYLRPSRQEELRSAPLRGPVETLTDSIQRTYKGTYFLKWLVAHRLGELAHAILIQREGEEALQKRRLAGRDWQPQETVQAYLEAGLSRSYEKPRARKWLLRKDKTPLEIDIQQVIEYLESQLETRL